MKLINRLSTIRTDVPDDIYITNSSFEDRCIGPIGIFDKYKSYCTVIINYFSDTNEEGELKKRINSGIMLKELQRVDINHMPRLISVGPYNYLKLIESLESELINKEINLAEAYITVDISCFTKIQLMFLIKYLIENKRDGSIRLIYTIPLKYNTKGDSFHKLSLGYYKPISIPFKIRDRKNIDLMNKAAILEIGHEGHRISSVWRKIDINKFLVVNPVSDDPDLKSVTERVNKTLLRNVRSGDPLFEEFICDRLDIIGATNKFVSFCKEENSIGNSLISIIPLGPKPLAIAALISVLSVESISSEIVYAIPTGYNSDYSKGVKGIYEYIL